MIQFSCIAPKGYHTLLRNGYAKLAMKGVRIHCKTGDKLFHPMALQSMIWLFFHGVYDPQEGGHCIQIEDFQIRPNTTNRSLTEFGAMITQQFRKNIRIQYRKRYPQTLVGMDGCIHDKNWFDEQLRIPRSEEDYLRQSIYTGKEEFVFQYLREEVEAPSLHFANTFPKQWFSYQNNDERDEYIRKLTQIFDKHEYLSHLRTWQDVMQEYPLEYYRACYLLPPGYQGPRVEPPVQHPDPGPGKRQVLDLSGK